MRFGVEVLHHVTVHMPAAPHIKARETDPVFSTIVTHTAVPGDIEHQTREDLNAATVRARFQRLDGKPARLVHEIKFSSKRGKTKRLERLDEEK